MTGKRGRPRVPKGALSPRKDDEHSDQLDDRVEIDLEPSPLPSIVLLDFPNGGPRAGPQPSDVSFAAQPEQQPPPVQPPPVQPSPVQPSPQQQSPQQSLQQPPQQHLQPLPDPQLQPPSVEATDSESSIAIPCPFQACFRSGRGSKRISRHLKDDHGLNPEEFTLSASAVSMLSFKQQEDAVVQGAIVAFRKLTSVEDSEDSVSTDFEDIAGFTFSSSKHRTSKSHGSKRYKSGEPVKRTSHKATTRSEESHDSDSEQSVQEAQFDLEPAAKRKPVSSEPSSAARKVAHLDTKPSPVRPLQDDYDASVEKKLRHFRALKHVSEFDIAAMQPMPSMHAKAKMKKKLKAKEAAFLDDPERLQQNLEGVVDKVANLGPNKGGKKPDKRMLPLASQHHQLLQQQGPAEQEEPQGSTITMISKQNLGKKDASGKALKHAPKSSKTAKPVTKVDAARMVVAKGAKPSIRVFSKKPQFYFGTLPECRIKLQQGDFKRCAFCGISLGHFPSSKYCSGVCRADSARQYQLQNFFLSPHESQTLRRERDHIFVTREANLVIPAKALVVDGPNRFRCPVADCSESFATMLDRGTHFRTHTNAASMAAAPASSAPSSSAPSAATT
eukprot:m.783128 g.783128  ORF g.783128 m.783128 type:complete len:613 (-) comp59152_c1_seq50:985-2823(-)